MQTLERLELPEEIYQLLQQMAQRRQMTSSEVVTDLVRRSQATEKIVALREEYGRLTEKALRRTITAAEEKRRDTICTEINATNLQSNTGYALELTNRRADELITKSEKLLASLAPQTTSE